MKFTIWHIQIVIWILKSEILIPDKVSMEKHKNNLKRKEKSFYHSI